MSEKLFSREAEQSVIGGLFVSPESFDEVVDRISEADFADPVHRLILKTMRHLNEQKIPIDILTVGECLESRGHLRNAETPNGSVDFGYLAVLVKETPSAANVLSYANIVRNYSQRRKIMVLAANIAEWIQETPDCGVVMQKCRQAIDAIDTGKPNEGPQHVKDVIAKMLEDMVVRSEKGITMSGISSGIPELDNLIDGLKPGCLYVIAARPGMGKTVMGVNFLRCAAKAGKGALLYTMEMPSDEVMRRVFATEQGLDYTRMQRANLNEDEWQRLCVAAKEIGDTQWWIDETPGLNISDLISRARRLHRTFPLGVIAVDYITLIHTSPSDRKRRDLEISEITRSLKELSKELSIPVVAMSQLNRDLEKRPDKRPMMSDLRESGSVEQDADVVMMLYRDEEYDPQSIDKGCAEIIIRKNRSGRCGMIPLRFDGPRYQFLPLPEGLPSANAPRPEKGRGFRD